MKKKKIKRLITGEERALRFALFHNRLFKQKIIPNKKKAEKLKRKKVDIREYQPFLFFYYMQHILTRLKCMLII